MRLKNHAKTLECKCEMKPNHNGLVRLTCDIEYDLLRPLLKNAANSRESKQVERTHRHIAYCLLAEVFVDKIS